MTSDPCSPPFPARRRWIVAENPQLCKCGLPSTMKQGHQWLCDKHYRFGQMRVGAKRHGKAVPTHTNLEAIAPNDMACRDCGCTMNWRARDGQSTVASLQHYRDGTFGIVCRSCNTRHAFMEGDSYRNMPADSKQCPVCKQIKPATEFTTDRNRSGQLKRKSNCRACADAKTNEWKENNRERYNEYQRQYRAKRKAAGNPVGSGR